MKVAKKVRAAEFEPEGRTQNFGPKSKTHMMFAYMWGFQGQADGSFKNHFLLLYSI